MVVMTLSMQTIGHGDGMTVDDPHISVRSDFDTFARASYPGLIGVATALTGRVEDAEDLVQDTMLAGFTRWDRIRRYEHPQGWAHRVLVNRCRGWWRRRRTRERHLATARVERTSQPGPSAEIIAFWQAVRRLPERHQQVIALHYAADLSVDEVSSVLDVPSGTVRSDLTRARAALAVMLEDRS